MSDYSDRLHPTSGICPKCTSRGRQSIVMAQRNGDNDWKLTCSDHSICNFTLPVMGIFIDAEFYLLQKLDGVRGLV